jgi:hypothetical protein
MDHVDHLSDKPTVLSVLVLLYLCTTIMLGIGSLAVLLLAIAGVQADHIELDAEVHHQLLLQGRPQVPLYRALLQDAQKQADRPTIHS